MSDQKGTGRIWQLYKMGGLTPAIASMMGAQNAQQMAFIRAMNREQRRGSALEQPLQSMEALVFDLETTGFHPYNGDEILSVGAVAMKGGCIEEGKTFYTLVNPGRSIPAHITELTGITNEMAAGAAELMQALHDFLAFAGSRILIAHGSAHDKQFLNAAMWRTSRISLAHRVLDTMMVAKWLEPKRSGYGLDELLEAHGIGIENRHHALGDSLMTAKLWQSFLAVIAARNVHTLGDLYAYLSKH